MSFTIFGHVVNPSFWKVVAYTCSWQRLESVLSAKGLCPDIWFSTICQPASFRSMPTPWLETNNICPDLREAAETIKNDDAVNLVQKLTTKNIFAAATPQPKVCVSW